MATFEEAIINEGLSLLKEIKRQKENLFNLKYWQGRIMEWAMKDQSLKTDLFRLVDVLPSLSNNDQIAQHTVEYLIKEGRHLPLFMGTAIKIGSLPLTKNILAKMVHKNVLNMAERFIIGQNIEDAKIKLTALNDQGFKATVDLLGEATLSEDEADDYFHRYKEIINFLPMILDNPNVSLKISALSSKITEKDPIFSISKLKERLLLLLRLAKQKGVFINFDVESFSLHEITYELFLDVILMDEFKDWPHLGIVVQAYLVNSTKTLDLLIEASKKRNTPITVRLVKGAYWDYEVVHAEQYGISCPVFKEKAATDLKYEALSKKLIDSFPYINAAFGSHNIRSLAHAIAYAKEKKLGIKDYEIQMLYGMSEHQGKALLDRGHFVRIYAPLGEMLPGLAYLVRRLLENTSQSSFLRLSNRADQDPSILLLKPVIKEKSLEKNEQKKDFINEGFLDFTDPIIREQFSRALKEIDKIFPTLIPKKAHIKEAEFAMELATKANSASLDERREHLINLSNILKKERFKLSALMCIEVGKTWGEADADVVEAIDYCRYYALCAETELKPINLTKINGEENNLYFIPRGPTVIIAPWNFPLAILCGMSVAAYVAGNPIIMKPSEQSAAIGYFLYNSMIKAGFIKEAVHFLAGSGYEIGQFLIRHPLIANIAFTGSKEVGHEIMKQANTVQKGQVQMKRVICEMGGKNAIIIDEDADIDEAILGIIHSAFSYAGQKCSAASRLILIGDNQKNFLDRLIKATKSLNLGNPILPHTFLGPVINKEAQTRLLHKISTIKQDSSLEVLYLGDIIEEDNFVPPTIVLVSDQNHWVMQEELFGPILAVYIAKNLDEAIDVANNTSFALTGGFYSRSPKNIEKVQNKFKVGNLYINQKITGALVSRQPFGGFKMSGTGIKAGGPYYLLNFVDQKVMTENTMRKGFTPEVSI